MRRLIVSVQRGENGAPDARACIVQPVPDTGLSASMFVPLVNSRLGIDGLRTPDGWVWMVSGAGPYENEAGLLEGDETGLAVATRRRPILAIVLSDEGGGPVLSLVRNSHGER
jgi:hypothetical protein